MADDRKAKEPGLTRRTLLASTGAIAGSLALGACKYGSQLFLLSDPPEADSQHEKWSGSRVKRYRPLGRTGFQMSDISLGSSGLSDAAVVRRAVERGITYFDTSPDYSHTSSETAIGAGIRGASREQLFIVSKFCTPSGHLANDTPVPEVIEAVNGSLQRLGTDHLDLIHIHSVNSVERLMAPNIHEAFDRLKDAGKVRFLAASSHSPDLETVMHHAVDCGRFDVIMVAYNFNNWPDLTTIFQKAHDRGIGVVAMKTLKGAHHTALDDFTPTERESFAQAAFKWVLSNSDVSGLVVSMSRQQQIDEYLYASGQAVTDPDVALLEKYDRLIAHDYCRPGCGDCLGTCPYGVPIDDVMRYQMYATNYGREGQARHLYARLDPGHRADHCITCAAPCERACDFDLPIRDKLIRADRLLG